ncbi:MAG TPA: hypothetical protein VFU43_21125 [Streptosporangiaceae bacterium]|nr:hypothetical protein [Streptosporangiaceae bacterium]
MKIFIRVGIPCIVVAVGLGIGLGVLLLGSHKELKYRTQAALLRAVPVTAADELRARGVRLTAPLRCVSMPEATKQKMRVACTGAAQGHRRIQVVAAGETKTQEHYYTILVGGRPVVQNAGCMGADCRHKD